MYSALVRAYRKGEVSFKNVITFNMDEYIGLPENDPQSYHTYMHQNLLDHIDIRPENAHILNGNAADIGAECAAYERAIVQAGGVDLFVGGVGRNGHLAFNEPGTSFSSRTGRVALTPSTREANARFFDNDLSKVPTHALSIGIGTLTDAREVFILVKGEKKAEAVRRLTEETPSENCPITVLRRYPRAAVLADEEACSHLGAPLKAHFGRLRKEQPDKGYWEVAL
jgi:glucosamine-6-phosphate deaminase